MRPSSWSSTAKRIRVPMGFAFVLVYLLLARPTVEAGALSLLLVGPGLALRAYASGYVKKNSELTTTGPYAYTRNPLYLGSMLIAFGFAAAARSPWIALLLALLFGVIYLPVIRGEEEFLRGAFPQFEEYAARVPRLMPRLRPAEDGAGPGRFSPALYRRHREYNALMGACFLYAALVLKMYMQYEGFFRVSRHWS